MKTVILDSIPSVNCHIPSNIPLNVSPAYTFKTKGQPVLGQAQVKYTHFVPVGTPSDHILDLLEVDETECVSDNLNPKPIEGYGELMKAEKVMMGKEKSDSPAPPSQHDREFENEAKQYVQSPNQYQEDNFQSNDPDSSLPAAKNDSHVANIIAAAQPKVVRKRTPKTPKKSKPSSKKTPGHKAEPKKTKVEKIKKFRILSKKRK